MNCKPANNFARFTNVFILLPNNSANQIVNVLRNNIIRKIGCDGDIQICQTGRSILDFGLDFKIWLSSGFKYCQFRYRIALHPKN
jgi:hypothetical protein